MEFEIFDPTTPIEKVSLNFVPRPERLKGLKLGLLDNGKFNSKVLLIKISDLLNEHSNMRLVHLVTKGSASRSVHDSAIKEFKALADFVIAGIGD